VIKSFYCLFGFSFIIGKGNKKYKKGDKMKKQIVLYIVALFASILWGEAYEYYILKNGGVLPEVIQRKSQLPILVKVNVSPVKKSYKAGEEVLVDVCYEYLTDHHGYVPQDEIEVGILDSKSRVLLNQKDFKIEFIGAEKGFLNDNNKKFTTKYKIIYIQPVNYTFLGIGYFIISGKTFIGLNSDKSIPERAFQLYKDFKLYEFYSFVPWEKQNIDKF
jgi:hypothetical protein